MNWDLEYSSRVYLQAGGSFMDFGFAFEADMTARRQTQTESSREVLPNHENRDWLDFESFCLVITKHPSISVFFRLNSP